MTAVVDEVRLVRDDSRDGSLSRSRGAQPPSSKVRPPSVGEVIARVHGLLDRVDASTAAASAVAEIDRAVHRLESLKLKAVAAADRDRVADVTGASGTPAWLAGITRERGDAAAGQVRLASALEEGLDVAGAALADGLVGIEHVAVIAGALDRLPDDVTADERVEVEQVLVDRAKTTDPSALRRAARRALAALERKRPSEVDEAEDAQLRTEEQAALRKARLTLHDNDDGTVSGHFTVPRLAGDVLRKIVQQLASPRRNSRQWRELRAGGSRSLDWPHLYGQAFTELLEQIPTDRLSGKVAATIVVTVDADKLRAGVGAAATDSGADLSISDVRRLACGAGLLPAVLDGAAHVLDLGRTERYFTEHQRVALATRYQECAAFGCDRPYAWTDLHHEDPWHAGGLTDLELAVPLCGHHHRRIHDPDYSHRVVRRDTGRKVVTYHRRT
jgi:hypothetical protein